jgi:hypothetical protein
MKLDRKGFLKATFGLVTGGIGLGVAAVVGCGGGSKCAVGISCDGTGGTTGGTGGSGAGAACDAHAPAGTIASNHGHVLTVTAAEVKAGAETTYHIMGTSAHDHTVVITAAMFAMLDAGQQVSTTSTSNGHSHGITVVCA